MLDIDASQQLARNQLDIPLPTLTSADDAAFSDVGAVWR